MKKIAIGEATVPQLRYHAGTVLGLELSPIMNGGQLRAKIEAAAPGTTEITVEDTPDSPAQAEAVKRTAAATVAAEEAHATLSEERAKSLHGMSAKQAAAHHNDPTIEIMIPPGPEAGGERDVPVCVNGQQWLIKRDVWTPVPYRVFEALQNASETKYNHTNNEIGQMVISQREVPSYPFQTRNGPSEAELEEWRKRVESVQLA